MAGPGGDPTGRRRRSRSADRRRSGLGSGARPAPVRRQGAGVLGGRHRPADRTPEARAADLAGTKWCPPTLPTWRSISRCCARWSTAPCFSWSTGTPGTRTRCSIRRVFGVNDYLDRNYAPLEERARQLLAHEEAALLEVGQVIPNLVSPLPRPFVETAIKVFGGYAEYLQRDVVRLLKGVGDPGVPAPLGRHQCRAGGGSRGDRAPSRGGRAGRGATWGTRSVPSATPRSCRSRKACPLPTRRVREDGRRQSRGQQAGVRKVSQTVLAKRPRARELLPQAAQMTEAARRFVEEWSIATIPAGTAPLVRETPPFMRWNQAFLVGPGPFERPTSSRTTTSPCRIPRGRPPNSSEYLMTFGTLVSTTVHEIYPGHFLQGSG